MNESEEVVQDEFCDVVDENNIAKRLDVFCAALCGYSRSYMQRMIQNGEVKVNNHIAAVSLRLKLGDVVTVTFSAPEITDIVAENIPISIIYEDSDIAVIDKARGMVVHPAPGNSSGTLVNAIMYNIKDLSGIGGEVRPGIVHRIDKLTSGLIVIAKNDFAHTSLAAQIKAHTAKRTYIALVDGNIKLDEGRIDAPIGRCINDRKRMAVVSGGREAVTNWRVLNRFGEYTLIEAKLETGRTHQIRVHMAYIKHPVTGDIVYGSARPKLGLLGQALHAVRLELEHPRTGAHMIFKAPLPEYFVNALAKLGFVYED